MKKILIIFLVLFSTTVSAQTVWQPMFLTTSGGHVTDGVEGWFAVGECNGNQVVYIKFVNTNSYDVTLNWYDGVFTQGRVWIYHNAQEDQKSLFLARQSQSEGNCQGNALLMINPVDFGITPAEFFRYHASELTITL